MSTYNRLSYLGTKGNLAVNGGVAGGQPVFTGNATVPFNVKAGVLAIFDPRANEFLDVADIATAKHISIALGVGKEGTMAKELRYLGGESFDLCNFEMVAEAAAPVCAQSQILYTFYDGTTCEKAPTIMYTLDDHIVRDRYNFNERAKYVFTANPPCTDCSSCTATDNGEAIRDSFVDQINAKAQENPFALSHFQNRDISHQYQPFRALKLYDHANSLKTFCLSLEDGTCQECSFLSGITGIIIDGVTTTFTYTTVDPGGDADLQTLPSQVDRVIEEINTALGVHGAAYKTKGLGTCCPYSIVISVDDTITTVAIETEAGDVNPCEEVNPFDSTDKAYGHVVIVDPVTIECLCDLPPDDVPNYYGRTLKAEYVGDGWGCNSVETVEKQAQVLPEGFGYFWQDLERYQHRGGSGRDFRNSDRYKGKTYVRPDKWSRTMAAPATIDCETSYCMYSLVTTARKLNKFASAALAHYYTDGDWVLVPEGDDTTITSWELYLNAMYERGICNAPTVSCSPEVPAAQSVTVLPATAALDSDGETLQLTKSVYPSGASQAGTWSTSNGAIATVSVGGLVTAVGNGTVTITFTSTDGGFTDTSVITVTNQV